MWTQTYSQVYQGVSKEAIWQAWKDVNNWAQWHDDLASCTMEGEFKVGNHFIMKIKNGPTVKIKLTEINEGQSFTDCTSFPGAKMFDIHELEETLEGLKITNTVKVTGLLSWLWVKLVAKNVAATAPKHHEELIELLRKQHV